MKSRCQGRGGEKRRKAVFALTFTSCICGVAGQASDSLFKGPEGENQPQEKWLKEKLEWRSTTRLLNSVTGDIYENPKLNWTRLSFVQPQVHLWDKYLYDERTHEYTVKRYLDDLTARYGGIDSVLLWPTYPNIGIDARNQWDLWRSLPGGLDGIKNLTDEFHAAGVKVLWGYNPFDQGLRDEGEPHWTTLVKLLKQTGGDGFNGDTMGTIYKEFVDAAEAIDYPVVGEAELGSYLHPWEREQDHTWQPQSWNTIAWGYYSYKWGGPDGASLFWREPGVDRAKWLESRGRRQTHVCDRWAKDRHDALQYAHFNGVGYESWENVWGVYMTFTKRDGEALRRLQTVWRWLGASDFTSNYDEWLPYTPEVKGNGIYASRWRHSNGTCAWTVVNRDPGSLQFNLEANSSACKGRRLFDLFSGQEVGMYGLEVEGHGYGAYLLTSRHWSPSGLEALLEKMVGMTGKLLKDHDATWTPLQQKMRPQGDPPRVTSQPSGMVLVPRTHYHFQTGGVEIEGGCDASKDTAGTGNCCVHMHSCPGSEACYDQCAFGGVDTRGLDVQFPWEPMPQRFHDSWLDIGPFYIDRHPVTNVEFQQYLNATGYTPRDPHNFLKHWSQGAPPAEQAQEPVVWVSLEEARGYCAWAGKRLPHAYEWQLAAQGTDGRIYPWGDEMNSSMFPTPEHGRELPDLPDVGEYPQGDSPFGMGDAVGLVWQFTDAFEDDRTRAVLLKGSAMYNPVLGGDFPATKQVGNWYFPAARKLIQHNRLLLMDESYDRAGTLGFRCVADHPDGARGPTHVHSSAAGSALLQEATGHAALAQCLRHGGARAPCSAFAR